VIDSIPPDVGGIRGKCTDQNSCAGVSDFSRQVTELAFTGRTIPKNLCEGPDAGNSCQNDSFGEVDGMSRWFKWLVPNRGAAKSGVGSRASRTGRKLRGEALEDRRVLATYVVDSPLDVVDPNDDVLTLREAVALATDNAGADTITFDPSLSGETIELSIVGNTDYGNSALVIDTEITIDGSAAPGLTIGRSSAQTNLRQLVVADTGILTLEYLTISGGQITGGYGSSGGGYGYGGGSGGGGAGLGGAIYNRGTLNIFDSTFSNNSATGGYSGVAISTPRAGSGGGGMAGNGTSALFTTPGTGGAGGGGDGGALLTSGSAGTYGGGGGGGGAGNTGHAGAGGAGGFGGGGGGGGGSIEPYFAGAGGIGGFGGGNGGGGDTLSFNVYNGGRGGGGAGMGGAIFNDGGSLFVINSTFSGNTATGGLGANNGLGLGGAIFGYNGTVAIYNSTLAGNTANDGGGAIYGYSGNNGTIVVDFQSTVMADTANEANDLEFTIESGFYAWGSGANLIENPAVQYEADLFATSTGDPKLNALADNGGPTQTMMPQADSPLIGNGSMPVYLDYDQIGNPRMTNGHVDIGAVQYVVAAPVIESIVRTTPTDEITSATELVFTITFSEDVTGVDATQIELTGTAAADCVIADVAGSGSVYTVTVTNNSAVGTLGLDVLEGVIENEDGTLYAGQIDSSETYTLEEPPAPPLTVLAVGTNPGRKSQPIVNVYDVHTGEQLSSIMAYPKSFNGGVRVAVGDLTGDDIPEIIVVPASKYTAEVKVFTPYGEELPELGFVVPPAKLKQGASIAVGDVNGDGWNDIITSSSLSQRSVVKVFENNYGTDPEQAFSSTPSAEFEAFSKKYKNGVSLATGDVNDDGAADIVVGSNKGQVTQISVFSMLDPQVWQFTQILNIMPFGSKFKGGVSVAAGDVDGDGHADIIAGAGSKGDSQVQIFNGTTGQPLGNSFTAYSTDPKQPVNVAGKDLNDDGVIDEIFTALGESSKDVPVKRYLTDGTPSPEGVDFVLETGEEFRYGLQLA
jgi:hypothetical protein